MKPLLAPSCFVLLAVGAAGTLVSQQAAPDTPQSIPPAAGSDANLRTDSKPHTSASPATDSAPMAAELGPGQSSFMDLGMDFSDPRYESSATHWTRYEWRKGERQVTELSPLLAQPLPLTIPPEPQPVTIADLPQPPVVNMPPPPSLESPDVPAVAAHSISDSPQ